MRALSADVVVEDVTKLVATGHRSFVPAHGGHAALVATKCAQLQVLGECLVQVYTRRHRACPYLFESRDVPDLHFRAIGANGEVRPVIDPGQRCDVISLRAALAQLGDVSIARVPEVHGLATRADVSKMNK